MKQAIVLAAGSSTRTNLGYSKILHKVNNKELLLYSVERFIEEGYKVILVVNKDIMNHVKEIVPVEVVVTLGGKTRCESTRLGLKQITSEHVLIHDAARPLITSKNIKDLEISLKTHDAAFLAAPVVDSIKSNIDGALKSINRDELLIAQTPQGFKTKKIKEAHESSTQEFSDDVSLYQNYFNEDGIGVVLNDTPNNKVTYNNDLEYVECFLNGFSQIKIGQSYDIHKLVSGRDLILGGVKLDYPLGLLGHSDADCLTHAITESIIGALGLGDIGTHFSDLDPKYKDICSLELLKETVKMMDKAGFEIGNIDSIVFAEAPKMTPYIKKMRESLAQVLGVDVSLINIKATTYEGMDAIGRGEAIAAESVCLLKAKVVKC